MITKSATAPLESLDFLPVRVGEAFAYFSGQLTDEKYPKWVRHIGADLAHQLLPPAWLESARSNRAAFIEGLGVGMLCASEHVVRPKEIQSQELAHIQRVMNTGVEPIDIPSALKLLTPQRVMKSAKKDIANALTKPAAARLAFFHGLTLGLDPQRTVTAAVESFAKRADRETALLRLYLWLRWPEFQELGSIPEAHRKCRRVFGAINRSHVPGTEEAFRRFCNRIGLTYRDKQRANREGQK